MVNVLGIDIGGANTKAAYISTKNGKVFEVKTTLKYFPFWKRDKDQLLEMLSNIIRDLSNSTTLNAISVTMTAELSDAFSTKREGVNYILDSVCQVSGKTPILVLNVDAQFCSAEAAKSEPLNVAAANWAATGWLVSQMVNECVVIDVGSTSTSIIPIVDGKLAATGKNDLEKLIIGELVYTGSLRTNVAAIVQFVPVKGSLSRVSSELFAQSGDVHLLLSNINSEEYTADTPDGKGKSRREAMARLARVVCADVEMLKELEIVEIAKFIFEAQLEQIAGALSNVYSRLKPNSKKFVPVVVTGFGGVFLAKNAAKKAGIVKIIELKEIMPKGAVLVSSAVGVALMAATRLEGRRLKWLSL
jgi:probable H4MPT-linked C1 transfer pathway protein